MGNPSLGFPTAKQSDGLFGIPSRAYETLGCFVLCGGRLGGAVPKTPATFEKVDETFMFLRG